MLFNQGNTKGEIEIKTLTGSYYANNDFARIEPFIEIAEDEMIDLLGQSLYDHIESIYNPTGSGSANGGIPEDEETHSDKLLKLYRTPIAYKAVILHNQANLVSHEDSGRKVKIDSDNEKMPWEWMLDRDDQLHRQLAGKTTDRLIKFLDKNKISAWMSSDNRKASRSQFINNTSEFGKIYPIDNSHSFYFSILPFIKEVQRKFIEPALGDRFADQLSAFEAHNEQNTSESGSGSGSGAGGVGESLDLALLDLCRDFIPLQVMVMTVQRRSLQILPDSIVQQFKSMVQSRSSSQPTTETVKKAWLVNNEPEARQALEKIKDYVRALDNALIDREYLPTNSADNNFCRT